MISSLIIPLVVLFVIIYAIIKKVPVYDTFIEGAKESFDMILKLFRGAGIKVVVIDEA